jgi:hypothetical protein
MGSSLRKTVFIQSRRVVMNEALKRYCKMANYESLRELADEFAIAGEDTRLEIVCDEIELRIYEDQKITKARCEQHDASQKRCRVQEMDEADTGPEITRRTR